MTETKEKTVLITKDGIRHDGRKKTDLREIKFEVGILDRADGSAIIYWGKNKILAAVYGPRELHPKHMALPDRALIRCEYRMATFSVTERKSPAPKRREKEISKILAEAIEPAVFDYLYPRSVIDVFIEVLQADGGSRCASITAAALALADAGIPMRDLVVGCAAGNLENQVVIDLDDVEDKEGQGDLPIAVLPLSGEVVLLQSDGVFTPEQYKEALDLLMEACQKIYKLQREAITNKYAKITEEIIDETVEVTSETPVKEKAEADKEKKKKAPKSEEKKEVEGAATAEKGKSKKKAQSKKAKEEQTEEPEKKKKPLKKEKKSASKKVKEAKE